MNRRDRRSDRVGVRDIEHDTARGRVTAVRADRVRDGEDGAEMATDQTVSPDQ